jgi:hypothetical protein
MGQEAVCSVTVGRRRVEGKALLETSEIIFRSPDLRLKIPFASIEKLDATNGTLRVTHAHGAATFTLGPAASKWADKIRNPKSLLDKLGVKPEHKIVVLGVRDAEFLDDLRARVPKILARAGRNADVIIFGAESLDELSRLAALRGAINPDGMIWTVTPKGKTGIKDTDVMAAGKSAGLVDVKVAAFSATHTASKFVIPKAQR